MLKSHLTITTTMVNKNVKKHSKYFLRSEKKSALDLLRDTSTALYESDRGRGLINGPGPITRL